VYYSAKGANDMKSKYTPGPWWYEIEHLNTFDDDDKCGVVFHDTAITGELHNGGYNIGIFYGPDKEGNAFLATRAPSMLSILEGLLQHCPPLDSKGRTVHRNAKRIIKEMKKYA
jgi:hypothetical protein